MMPLRTTARMTALSPGQSPPPVRMPILIAEKCLHENSNGIGDFLQEVGFETASPDNDCQIEVCCSWFPIARPAALSARSGLTPATLATMRVLGIDCGGEYTGYGVVEQDEQGSLHHLCSGAIRLSPRDALELRLKKICDGLTEIIAAHSPEQVAIEDVFYAVNAKSALKLGHVRGVAMLVAAQAGLEVVAYSPLSIDRKSTRLN